MTITPKMVTVEIRDNSYSPQSIPINKGDTVQWMWVGTDPTHTVTAKDGLFSSGAIFTTPGKTYEVTFNQNGTFEYFCVAHGAGLQDTMKGSVRVGAAAPDPDPGY